MLRANALFSVVSISLLIGVFISSLIMIAYFQRLQIQKDLIIKKLYINCNSGINILLGIDDYIAYDEPKIMDLYGDEIDSVILKKQQWGIFEIATVKAFSGGHQKVKSVLYGYKLDNVSNSAIYLTDQNSPVSLGGNTYIKGTCYLPTAGVKRAYIEGSAFSGSTLINGEIKKSNYTLPPLNKNILKNLSVVLQGNKNHLEKKYQSEGSSNSDAPIKSKNKTLYYDHQENIKVMIDEEGRLYQTEIDPNNEKNEESIPISNSFLKDPILIFKQGTLLLKEKKISGNVIFYSDKLVVIDSSCQLDNVLIFAPAIVVNDHFQGTVQLFSTDSINIGRNCNFLYPSVIGLVKKELKEFQPYIKVNTHTSFKGIIFSYGEVQDLKQTYISIDKDVLIEGQIYSEGFLEVKGTVWGSVSCNQFSLRTPSSVYSNHLMNATIDNSKLSPHYIGSSLITSKRTKGIISWLE